MKPTREFYIPKTARKIQPKATDGVVFYAYERGDAIYGLAFIGKRTKPEFHYRYRTEAERTKRFEDTLSGVLANEEFKAKRRAERAKPHNLEVGMILYGSWGYEQTNVDFFEVVRATKRSVWVEEIGSQTATDAGNGAWMTDRVVPNLEARTGKITQHIVTGDSIKSPKHGTASVWDGTPKYESSYH